MKDNYAKIFYQFPVPSMLLEIADGEWIIRSVNDKYCDVTGRKREELIDRNIAVVFPENSRQESQNWQLIEASLGRVLGTSEPDTISHIQYDIINPQTGNFEQRYWSAENFPLLDEDGKEVQFILHTAIDRTAEVLEQKRRKDVQDELEQKELERQILIEANPDGLYSLDIDGNFISVNNGACQIVERPKEEVLKMNFRQVCPAHEVERVTEIFQDVLHGENREFEVDFLTETGGKKILKISLVPLKMDGTVKGAYGIVKEVTGIRETQKALLQKEQELLKNKNKFSALVQEAFDLTGVLNLEGTFIYASESSTSVLGVPPEDFIGKNAFDFIHPEDKERVMKVFSEIETQKNIKVAPFRFMDRDGAWRWMETNVTNLIDDPNVGGIVINTREITDLICKNQELQQLYERYELAAAATGDLIYDWDLITDTVKRFFKGKEKQLGYDTEEMAQRTFWREHVHPEELEDLRKLLRNTLTNPHRNQIRSQYRLKRADGSYAHVIDRGMIVRDENGKAIRVIGATSDISGLINRRDALRIANKRFTYAMKATQEMIWDWDIVNNTIERGKSVKQKFGYDPRENPSKENFWFSRVVEKDRQRITESMEETLKDPSLDKWREEYRILKPDGEIAYVIDRGYIIRNHTGKAIRMVGATLDVTESRRMLKEIKKQNKILREVAWEQAHVVRAPIARLKGLLNLFEEEYNGEWDKEEIMGLIKDSADELDNIVIGIIKKTEGIEVER